MSKGIFFWHDITDKFSQTFINLHLPGEIHMWMLYQSFCQTSSTWFKKNVIFQFFNSFHFSFRVQKSLRRMSFSNFDNDSIFLFRVQRSLKRMLFFNFYNNSIFFFRVQRSCLLPTPFRGRMDLSWFTQSLTGLQCILAKGKSKCKIKMYNIHCISYGLQYILGKIIKN